MGNSRESLNYGKSANTDLQIINQVFSKSSLSWFDIKVFYIRISNFVVDNSTPEFLTVNHIPLSVDTLLEVNGTRCSTYSDGASCILRRDRVDKKSEVATFVSTDSIRLSGSMKFQVFDRDDCLMLSGVLEKSNINGFIGESKNGIGRWSMSCESMMSAGSGLLNSKGKPIVSPTEPLSPTVEVYIAGCFSGTPIILTKSLQLNPRSKDRRKGMLYSIPEHEPTGTQKDVASLQLAKSRNYEPENENVYWRKLEYLDGEDGELTWFNAGVRVGVGIGLGACVGIGIGVGLLARTYQVTSRNFRRRFL